MKLFTYCPGITFVRGNTICPSVDFVEATSEEEAIKKATVLPNNLKYILEGYKVEKPVACKLPNEICPSNSEFAFCYNVPEDKITTLTINMEYTTSEFRKDLKNLLNKHWTKDLDKL